MTAPIAAAAPASPGGTGASARPPTHGLTFHEVLSALNPLQYLPVIGTIYRAVTGDEIPEAVRRIGSLIVSGLLGGPIGIAINIATTAAEKIAGIDLDQTGQALVHGESLGQAVAEQTEPGGTPAAEPVAAAAPPASAATTAAGSTTAPPPTAAIVPATAEADSNGVAAPPQPWSAAQLAAYGVQSGETGTLRMGRLQGAEVLNALELARLRSAHATYAQVAALAQ